MTGKAVIYARQSFTRAGSESLAIQVDTCRRTAAHYGLDIVAELVEPPSTSAFKNRGRGRPKFRELLHLIHIREADAVIVYTTDRLSRGGGPGWAPLVDAFERARIDIDHAVLTASGWLSEIELSLRAVFDREESRKLSVRMRDARARHALAGRQRVPGIAGYGYTRHMVIVPEEAEAIRAGVAAVSKGATWREAAAQWTAAGYKTRLGAPWSGARVRIILTSGRIAGWVTLHGRDVARAPWPPIITQAQHQLMQAIATRRATRPPYNRFERFPLLGFVRCYACDSYLQPWVSQTDALGYRCDKPHATGQPQPHIGARFLEPLAGQVVSAVLADPVRRSGALRWLTHPEPPVVTELIRRLQEADNAQADLADEAGMGDLDHHHHGGRRRALDLRTLALTETIGALGPPDPAPHIPTTPEDINTAWQSGSVAHKRALLRATLDRVILHTGKPGPGVQPDRLRWHLIDTPPIT